MEPGIAENSLEARCTQTIMRGLETIGENEPVYWRDFSKKHHLDRYGSATVQRVVMSLKTSGAIEYWNEESSGGRPRKLIALLGED